MISKRFIKLFLAIMMVFTSFANTVMAVQAQEVEWTMNVVWEDRDDKLGLRPDSVNFYVANSSTKEKYMTNTVSAADGWTKKFPMDTDWENVTIGLDSGGVYDATGVLGGRTATFTMTCIYNDSPGDIYVDTVWVDDDNAGNTRPETYSLEVTDKFGSTYTYDIGKNQTEYKITDIPFAKDGVVNEVSAESPDVQNYSSNVKVKSDAKGTHISVILTYAGVIDTDALKPGLNNRTFNGEVVHVYKASGNEELAVLSTPMNADGTYQTLNINDFARKGIKIKAIVNASYFNCKYDDRITESYPTTVYGRIQGMTTDGGIVNATTKGPEEGVTGIKPFIDLVVKPDGTVDAGNMNSWDYHENDNSGYPNNVMLGISPAVVEKLGGEKKELYSSQMSGENWGKVVTKDTQTMLLKTKDGSWALATVEKTNKGLAPRNELTAFADMYGLSELSVYDSGGSTQMSVNGQNIQYTKRTFPVALIIYEKADAPEKATLTIKFNDTDKEPTDLSAYTIIKEGNSGETVETGIAEVVNRLKNEGYSVSDESWSEYERTECRNAEITIDVAHEKKEVTSEQDQTYTRTIKYVDEDGTALDTATVQTLKAHIEGKGLEDQVTKKVEWSKDTTTTWENDTHAYPAVKAPEIKGYKPNKSEIAADDISEKADAERTYEEKIVYSKTANTVDVYVEIVDDNKNPQDMSAYSQVYTLNLDAHETADLTQQLNKLKEAHYTIPDILPVIGGAKDHVVIHVDHEINKMGFSTDCGEYPVTIRFSDKDETETWIIDIDGQSGDIENVDLVTGEKEVESVMTCSLDPMPVPTIEGYTPNISMIEGFKGDEPRNIPDEIIYQKNEETDHIVNVVFEDVSKDPQDLSAYNTTVKVSAESAPLDVSPIINALTEKGYSVNTDDIPEVVTRNDETVKISVSHKTEETNTIVGTTEFKRTVSFVDDEQKPVAEAVVQTLNYDSVTSKIKDLVTGKETSGQISRVWRDGADTFPEVKVPAVDGYSTAIDHVDAFKVTDVERQDYSTSIVYLKESGETVDFELRFEDANKTEPQDLSQYNKIFTIDMSGRTEYDMPEAAEIIKVLESKGYEVISKTDHVTRENKTYTVVVDHKTHGGTKSGTAEAKRVIHFAGIEKDDVEQTETVNLEYEYTVDDVTGHETQKITNVAGKIAAYEPEKIEQYSVDPEIVPELVIDSENKLDTEVTVTYKKDDEPVTPEKNPSISASLSFAGDAKVVEPGSNLKAVAKVNYENLKPGTDYVLHSMLLKCNDEIMTVDSFEASETDGMDVVIDKKTPIHAGESGQGVTDVEFEFDGSSYDGSEFAAYHYLYDASGEKMQAMDKNQSAGNRIKVAVKEPGPQEDETLNVVVRFTDDDANKQDLSSYQITREIRKGEETEIDISESVNALKEKGYIVSAQNTITADGSETEYVIHVTHDKDVSEQYDKLNAKRTFRYEGINKANDSQATEILITKQVTKDKVTGEESEEITFIDGTLDEFKVPEIEGYIPSPATFREIDFAKEGVEKLEFNELVRYVSASGNVITVNVSYIDDDDAGNDLSDHKRTILVNEGETAPVNVQEDIAGFEANGYVVVAKDSIPATTDGSNTEIVIHLKHGTKSTEKEHDVNVARTVHYKGIDHADDVQKAVIKRIDRVVTDAVNGKKLSETSEYTGSIPAFTTPKVAGFVADAATLPEVVIDSAEKANAVYETTVTYGKEAVAEDKVVFHFADSNSTDKTDLSKYDMVIDYQGPVDVSKATAEQNKELLANHYVFDRMTTDSNNVYTLYYKHAVETTNNDVRKEYTRELVYKYENGIKIKTDTQKASVLVRTTNTKDLVTGRTGSDVQIVKDGNNAYKFDEVTPDRINGYNVEPQIAPSVDLTNTKADEKTKIVFTYKKNNTVVVNTDPATKPGNSGNNTGGTGTNSTGTASGTTNTTQDNATNARKTANRNSAGIWYTGAVCSTMLSTFCAYLLLQDKAARRRKGMYIR